MSRAAANLQDDWAGPRRPADGLWKGRAMRDRRTWTRLGRGAALAAVAGLALVAAGGCREQQLEERNLALQRQLEVALLQNAELQTELDRARSAPAPEPAVTPVRPAPAFEEPPALAYRAYRSEPAPAPVPRTRQVVLTLTHAFDPGKGTLRADAKARLDAVVPRLQGELAAYQIRVEGHTDSTPIKHSKWESNWALSEARADAVVKYLAARGIARARLAPVGVGASQPVATNATAEGRARNRRIEIIAVP